MPGRIASSEDYRYGFNGKEKDDEVKGSGAQYDYGFRIYDARMGRFLSVDPLSPDYPWYTPFQFAGNKPIRFIDLDGLEEWDVFLALNDEEKVTGALVKLVKSEGDLKVNWYGGTLRDGFLLFQKNLGETNSFRGPSTKVGDLLNEDLTAQEGGFSVKSTGESFHKDKWVIVGLRGDNGNYLTRSKSILIRFPASSDVSDEERVNLVNKTLEENLPSLKETVQDVPDGMLAMYFNYIPDVNDPKLLEKTSSTINSFFPGSSSQKESNNLLPGFLEDGLQPEIRNLGGVSSGDSRFEIGGIFIVDEQWKEAKIKKTNENNFKDSHKE